MERMMSTTHCKHLSWTGSSTTFNPRRLLYKQPVGKNALFMPEFLCCEAWKITRMRVFLPAVDILGHSDQFSELVQWFPVTSAAKQLIKHICRIKAPDEFFWRCLMVTGGLHPKCIELAA